MVLAFGLGFVLLGVGSGGGSGLSDVFQNIFSGGSSGPSVKSLQKRVTQNPKNAEAYFKLGEALERDAQTAEAIAAYEQYVKLRPKSLEGLNQLAALYGKQARTESDEGRLALVDIQVARLNQFGPAPTSQLGLALTPRLDTIEQAVYQAANERYRAALDRSGATGKKVLDVYERIAALSPNDASAQLQVAITAQPIGEFETALTAYRRFLELAPDDPQAAYAKEQIKTLEKQVRSGPTSVTSPPG